MKEREFIHYLSDCKFLKKDCLLRGISSPLQVMSIAAESHRQAEGAITTIASKNNSQDNKYAYVYSELNVKFGPEKHKHSFSYDYSWTMTREAYFCPLYNLSKYVYSLTFKITQTEYYHRVSTKECEHLKFKCGNLFIECDTTERQNKLQQAIIKALLGFAAASCSLLALLTLQP